MMETHFPSRDPSTNTAPSSNDVHYVPEPLPLLDGFVYQPLAYHDGEDFDFRLLSLHPGQFEDQIHCDIFHANIKSEIEYDAVSV